MLATKVAFPIAVLFLVSLASEARYHSRLSRVLQSSDDRDEQDWYFEQCHFVNAWKEHLGHVSVLVFLDPAWQYSFRQAVMLELLCSRLLKSGFPDVRFFVINPFSVGANERSEDDFEIKAWREIGAKYEIENFVDDAFLKSNGSEIIFLQDDSQSRIWERFRASREQVIIIDRCGKLTYHVIVPWSILFFPYVKAAILSTYKEDPCGGCDPAAYRVPNHHVVELTKGTEEEASPPENATLHHEESVRGTSIASSVPLEKITNNSDRSNLPTKSPTETAYRYGNDEVAEDTRSQDDTKNSEGDDIVPIATFEPQRDVLPPEQKASHPPADNNSLTPANHHGDAMDGTLLLDEPATASDSMSASEETTASNYADGIRDNTTPEKAEGFREDEFLPLRIIMYAPHVHENGRKKHTHLVLKSDDPDFHGHLDSEVDVATPPGVDYHVASSEESDWGTTEIDADERNVNQKYTFDEDESPGLYGEVADYWKSYEDNDVTDRNETFNNTYDNSTATYNEEHRSNNNSDHTTSLSKPEESYLIANATEHSNVGSFTDSQNIVGSNTIASSRPNDQVDREEEMQYKLIEHYNKLLSWIDYKLNK